jgi:RND family efflux transporter MFP subunit
MQSHDQHNPPDATSRSEGEAEEHAVSAKFDSGTGKTVKVGVIIAAAVLLTCFAVIKVVRAIDAHSLTQSANAAYGGPPPVDVIEAKAVTTGQDLMLPGQTAAWYETTIYARVNGYVAKWMVDIGDHVQKGQVLATIETPELDAELKAARAQLQSSQAQANARRAEAEFSKTTNERWRDSPKGVVSEQERESKKADYESARARLYSAEAQVALDEAKVDQYKAMMAFRQVTAPFDGTITERKIDIGNLVTAGSTSATTGLYRIAQCDPLRVFVDVPQTSAGELSKAGVPAQIRSDGVVTGVFIGKTARSAESVNAQTRTMRVEVDLPNADHRLMPGMYVNVGFQLKPRGVVEVPAAALIFRPNATQVARVGTDGKVSFVTVSIARDNGALLELGAAVAPGTGVEPGRGVEPGDRLVLNISSQIAAGQTVRVTQDAAVTALVKSNPPPVQAR